MVGADLTETIGLPPISETLDDTRAEGAHLARARLPALALGALGVVFGDIGTSPLYAIDQVFFGPAAVAPSPENVIGAISLAILTLVVIVAIKYAALVLRADNEGEGGVFAIYGLLHPFRDKGYRPLLWALMLGAGLLLGDGMITPAISVLSAVEGLEVVTPGLSTYVLPITLALLTLLFGAQFKGTARMGVIFGPVLLVWFIVIAALGLGQILRAPGILAAFNPWWGLSFLFRAGPRESLTILGAMMLVVTGGEAMYADLGHFGARPIRLSWFVVVFPALLLNYLGQGAYLLSGQSAAAGKLFYSLAPAPLVLPLVVLATLATIVASQALISGAFSLSMQAIGLGLLPRIGVRHTHEAHAGPIYVPFVNAALYVGCVALVIGFGSSSALGSAYGLAVAGVMVITSFAMFAISRRYWRWSPGAVFAVWLPLTLVNLAFLAASTLKFFEGGYVPLGVGVAVFFAMATWRWGRKATFAAYSQRATMTMSEVVRLHRSAPHFIERNALVMSPHPLRHPEDNAPALASLIWERYGLWPRHLVFVEVTHPKTPYVLENRYHVTVFDRDEARGGVIGVELKFGFMEDPNVERCIADLAGHRDIGLPADPAQWIVHVAHENLLPEGRLPLWRRARFRLFLFLRLVSRPAYYAYGLGDEVRLSAEILPVSLR